MFTLSTLAKEAIKIGIAMVIGFGAALRLEWMSSTWVAISIAMISLHAGGSFEIPEGRGR